MKYYLVVGEASGDLHASHLMAALREHDKEAEFRFFGGDLMAAQGGTRVHHFKELAYMGFVPVLLHLPTIFRRMRECRADVQRWQPDALILVDYPGFNLSLAQWVHRHAICPVFYYISPKIWAWKEWRIRSIRRYVDAMFCILPFEKAFYEQKHHYPVHYVGNPTVQEVALFRERTQQGRGDFCAANGLHPTHPIIALLAGSRRQEIKDNLPAMLQATLPLCQAPEAYQVVVAGAPALEQEAYAPYMAQRAVPVVFGQTYELLSHATVALVTSGTATLETALLGVPQVVCYKTPLPRLIRWAFEHILSCRFISLVNLIADREVVPELFADRFSVEQIAQQLRALLPQQPARHTMLEGYKAMRHALGQEDAPQRAAQLMVQRLKGMNP